MDYELLMNANVKIGMQAPDFEAVTTMGIINLNDYRGKWIVLFSHPGDFTPVCTTEIIAMANANTYFENLNTKLIGLSVDSNSSHLAWLYDIYLRTGITVPFPIISDRNGTIARKYGMISNDISNTETVRNVYIINPEGIVKSILIYPIEVGRFIPEISRLIKALQITECCKVSTGANWMPGNPLIMRTPQNFKELQDASQNLQQSGNGIGWYLRFQNPKECETNNQIGVTENNELNFKNLNN